jgi:hypothetical protein
MSPNADFSPESAVEGEKITSKPILTFFDFPFERTYSPSKPEGKRAKRDGGGSTANERSSRVRFCLRSFYQFQLVAGSL